MTMLPMPRLIPALEVTVSIGMPLDLGRVDGALRRFVPITGGHIEGPRFKGEILPGGGDWQTLRSDGTLDVVARYSLRADDGATVSVVNTGYRRASPEIAGRIAAGEDVDPALYYFRTTPRFEVATGSPHAWLAETVFVATAARHLDRVMLSVFAVE